MSTGTLQQPNLSGKKYRFVVRTAEEAVGAIREQLGETARVVSVRQVEGEGLSRFLRSPRLEVIAEVPAADPVSKPAEAPVPQPAPVNVSRGTMPTVSPSPASANPAVSAELKSVLEPAPVVRKSEARPAFADVLAAYAPQPEVSPSSEMASAGASVARPKVPRVRPAMESPDRFWSVLERAGCSSRMLSQFRGQPEWQELASKPLSVALPRAALLLRDTVAAMPVRPLMSRIAFFGTAGAGATTALCKQLVRDVFFSGRSACVMKLEGERSNPAEGLAAFCEALNVPFLRSPEDLSSVPADHKIYFDVPSLTLSEKGNADLIHLLDEFEITSRVLVVNAAYDVELLKAIFGQTEELRARHVVFTHVDELTRWGKLWEFVADSKRTVLFASTGQNLAGDCVRDVVDLLAQRTLHSSN